MSDQWWALARCAEADPEVFFPDRGQDTSEALAYCTGCPVLIECRAHALALPERFGIWGGLTEDERLALRQLTAAGAAARSGTGPIRGARTGSGAGSGSEGEAA